MEKWKVRTMAAAMSVLTAVNAAPVHWAYAGMNNGTSVSQSSEKAEKNVRSEALEDTDGLSTASGSKLIDDYDGGKMLEVTAGWNNQNGGHADFKNAETLFQKESFTLSADMKVTDTDHNNDNSHKKSAFTIGTKENCLRIQPHLGIFGYGGGASGIPAVKVDMTKKAAVNTWISMAVVYNEDAESGYVTIYMDGEKVLNTQKLGFKLSSMNQISASVARSFDTNFLLNGIYDHIVVSDEPMKEEEAVSETASRAEQKQKKALWDGVSLSKDSIVGKLNLPVKNTAGDAITWKSSNPDILDNDGKVVKAPGEDTQITMTGEIGGYQKSFTVTVAGGSVLLQKDYESLTLENLNDVRGNLPLVKEGKNGSSIQWTSDQPDVITDSDSEDSLYDGGIVHRPEAGKSPVKVTLSAKLSMGDNVSKTKTFTAEVQPKPANLDKDYTAGYLWTNFDASGGYEKIFYGFSKDGLNWSKLNKDKNGKAQPILTNDAEGSDLGVRDPHLIRSPEGDKYWLLGTDLHAEGGGAGGTGWHSHGGSKDLVVWESEDLVNWSKPKLVFAGLDTAGCVWAPEAIYDESTGDYLVYWSARDEKNHGSEEGDPLCVYLTRTRDFNTFSEPEVWLNESKVSGKGVNIIDSTITYDAQNHKYYRFSTSDWHTILDVSDSLNGLWERVINRGESEAHGFSSVEGLTCYQLPDGRWCAMGDNQGYKAFVTDDLSTADFVKTNATFDERFRHGSVIRLSQAEEEKIMNAYGTESQVEKAYIGIYPTPPGDSEDPDNTAGAWKGKDDHTAVSAKVDSKNKKITSYVQPEADLSKLELDLTLVDMGAQLKIDGKKFTNGDTVDLTKDAVLEVITSDITQKWTIEKPEIAYNPVLPGQFADPDIDYFDGKYWMCATTDGYGGKDGRWTSYDFHMFSSDDMVHWEDEGVILDVKNKNPGKNENGVDIASVAWSEGNAWAPSIEKKGDKYYFYFCAKKNGTSCIGVAVSDRPAGPYKAMEEPMLTPDICSKAGASVGQTIDPSIFKDSDGKYYIYFGNGSAAVAQLNDDMVSIKEETMKKISGMKDFRESVVVNKIGNKYHFTWSCNDAGSEDYSVNYGVSDSPYGPVDFKYTLLKKNKENDMVGTGHQSMLEDPKTGKLYISYHRFFTPLGVYTNSRYFGIHRESCINQVPYDEESGLMLAIKPTMEGIMGDIVLADGSIYEGDGAKKYVTVNYKAAEGGQVKGVLSQKVDKDGDTSEVEAVAEKGYKFVQWSDGKKEAKRMDRHVQSDVVYTAQFEKEAEAGKKVTVKYMAGSGGRIEGQAVQQISAGQTAQTVKAVADSGYRFVRWSDGLTSAVRTDKNVRADQILAAYFEKIVIKPVAVTGLKSYSNKTASLKLTWKKNKDAKGYEVYRYSSKYKKYIKVKTTGSSGYYDLKLQSGAVYSYKVRAYKYNGNTKLYGLFSKTLKTATAPSKVSSLKVKKASRTKINLTWKKTKGASGYAVYMKTGNGKYKRIKTITKGTIAKYSKTKLKKGRKYTFKIRAYKKADKKIYGGYSSAKSLKLR